MNPTPSPEINLQSRIVLQNKQFVIVDKPAQWLSVPGRFQTDDRPILGLILQNQLNVQIFPVHRLDFEVSGVMIFALNKSAHRQAGQLFEKQLVKKTYQARSGPVREIFDGRQVWKRKILRGKKRSYESPHGDLAVTEAELVSAADGDWRLMPRTGKPHQLRVELALRGYPIAGDALYGSTVPWVGPGIALRAIALELPEEFAKAAELPAILRVDPFA